MLLKSEQETTDIPTAEIPNKEVSSGYLSTQWVLGKRRGELVKTSQNQEVICMVNM